MLPQMFGEFEGLFPFDSNGPSPTGNEITTCEHPPNGGEK